MSTLVTRKFYRWSRIDSEYSFLVVGGVKRVRDWAGIETPPLHTHTQLPGGSEGGVAILFHVRWKSAVVAWVVAEGRDAHAGKAAVHRKHLPGHERAVVGTKEHSRSGLLDTAPTATAKLKW